MVIIVLIVDKITAVDVHLRIAVSIYGHAVAVFVGLGSDSLNVAVAFDIQGSAAFHFEYGGVAIAWICIRKRGRVDDVLAVQVDLDCLAGFHDQRGFDRHVFRQGDAAAVGERCMQFLRRGDNCDVGFVEIRIDLDGDIALLGQQITRYHGAVVAADGNALEIAVGRDLFTCCIEERHLEVGQRSLFDRRPDVVHRQLAGGVEHVGRVFHGSLAAFLARQCVERVRKRREIHFHLRGFQVGRVVGNRREVERLHVQLAEGTAERERLREGLGNRVVFLAEEEGVELVVVAGVVCIRSQRDCAQVIGLVAGLRAVGPEYEVILLLSHQPQVERCGVARYRCGLLLPVGLAVPVDLEQAAVDLRAVAEIRRCGTGLYSLRNRDGNRLRGRSCGWRDLVLLTCGQGHRKARRQ